VKHLLSSALVLAVVLSGSYSAQAQSEVTLIAPGGIRAPIEQLFPLESKTGNKVKATFGSGNGTKQQVIGGEAFDVPVVQVPYDQVIASGNVVTNTERLSRTSP